MLAFVFMVKDFGRPFPSSIDFRVKFCLLLTKKSLPSSKDCERGSRLPTEPQGRPALEFEQRKKKLLYLSVCVTPTAADEPKCTEI